jgi:haloalkane dehalogenase
VKAVTTKPYAALDYREVLGRRMAYIDKGEGDAIVFQHGQPTSSYVWRNVMPHLEGLGRLIACDLIGMGGSDKLPPGPDRYSYAEHREYLFGLWDALALGDRVVLVLDDWGATLGFDWANRHRDRVAGIVHMEAVALPLHWSDLPEQAHPLFRALRSPAGERLVLEENLFIEDRLPNAVLRRLGEEEMDHYRRPFRNAGEDRRPTLSWPRNLPIDGEPAAVVAAMDDYAGWLAQSDVPKLFVNGEPGAIVRGRIRDTIRGWRNQTEITVRGMKLLQEDSPHEIGAAVTDFVRWVRPAVPKSQHPL